MSIDIHQWREEVIYVAKMSVMMSWCRLATLAVVSCCLIIILSQFGLNMNWTHISLKILSRFKQANGTDLDTLLDADGDNIQSHPRSLHRDNITIQHNNSFVKTSAPKVLWQGTEGKVFADYGDKSCGPHPARSIFKAIVKQWIKIAKHLNITTYFLTCGTLLGSYRDSELIPNDGDLDVLIDIKDYPKLKKIAQKRNFRGDEKEFHFVLQVDFEKPVDDRRRFSCGGKHVPSYMDHCSFQEPLGRLIKEDYHLDLYHYIIKNNTVEDPSEGGRVYKKKDIFPLKYCMFMGIQTTCPFNPKPLLTMLYGEDLRPRKICQNGDWIDNT